MRYLLLVIAMLGIAHAHQSSTKYLDVTAADDRVTLTLRFAPGDVTEPMKLRPDAKPSLAEAAAAPGVPRYVQRWLEVRGCSPGAATAAIDGDLVAATWTCAPVPDPITLDLTAFFALDPKMEMFVRTGGDDSIRVTAARPQIVIAHDHDHVPFEAICFGLVIAVVATSWRSLAIMVGAYMLAVTAGSLSGAALPIPALVAATVIVAGGELFVRESDWRIRLAEFVAFGVLHGVVQGSPANLIFSLPAILATAVISRPFVRSPRARRVIGPAVALGGVVWLLTCVLR
ncbi:MAG TPA: hypothetical protein VGC41_11880 [Kofleriaceae bacterium]